jgi:hypothetical protein
MAFSLRFSVFHSDLNGLFLASVGDQQNGMPFSAISALTRLGRPMGGGGPARSFADGPRDRGARADDRSMSMRRPQRSDYVAIAQRLGRASANAREFGRAGSRVGQYADQEIFSRCDVARLLCPWGGSILRHVVIGFRPGFRSVLRSSALEFLEKWSLLMPTTRPSIMKYVVPPIVIPVLLFIGIVAYAMLRPPITDAHPPTPAANSQPR